MGGHSRISDVRWWFAENEPEMVNYALRVEGLRKLWAYIGGFQNFSTD